ncbi:hypothetical protein SteCoe_35994 [Stentor coeruleus]|uniref:Uncharacterized protein n=1 Tax=Stentor coeruleus TaxID=5963 RepID=A0A1R2AR14_9CILI|nr:hypothetical protein SteCoe_35994 [Stentor coeruleus]
MSDSYFQNKDKQKRSTSLKRNFEVCNAYNDKRYEKIVVDCCEPIAEGIKSLAIQARKHERQLVRVFCIIVDGKYERLTDSEISMKIVTSEFLYKLRTFCKFITIGLNNQNKNTLESVYKAHKQYSNINFTLYGYRIIKLVVDFVENTFEVFNLNYKKVKIINYFDEVAGVENIPLSKSLNINTCKKNTPDPQYETTKDDEEFLYTNPDTNDYEKLSDYESVGHNIKPDHKKSLLRKFFNKHNTKNPYDLNEKSEKVMKIVPEKNKCIEVVKTKSFDWEKGTRVDKLNMHTSQLKMFRKFEDKFVDFVINKYRVDYVENGIQDLSKEIKNHLIEDFIQELKTKSITMSETTNQNLYSHFHDKKTLLVITRKIKLALNSLYS